MDTNIPELNSGSFRKFAFTTSGLLVSVFGLALPWLYSYSRPLWPWITAVALALLSLLLPASLRPVYRGWMKIAHAFGKVNSLLILTVIFIFVIIPVGVIMRIFGYNPMRMKSGMDCSSFRRENILRPNEDMKKPF